MSSSAACVNDNIDFSEDNSYSSTWRRSDAPNESRNTLLTYQINTQCTFTSDTRSPSSSHVWFSSATVKCRRGEPLQWGGNLRKEGGKTRLFHGLGIFLITDTWRHWFSLREPADEQHLFMCSLVNHVHSWLLMQRNFTCTISHVKHPRQAYL